MTAGAASHVVLTGGGTGGHLFPGLAVAERLVRAIPGVRITFAGSGRQFERRHVAAAGFDYLSVPCRPLPRRPWQFPRFLLENLVGYRRAGRFLARERVAAVVGLGGFASVPTARAAIGRRLPLVLLEQNAVAGRANRWLAPAADAVCLACEPARSWFRPGCRLQVTGNPLRAAFEQSRVRQSSLVPSGVAQPGTAGHDMPADDPGPRRQLLVLGGSGGARSLNENVPQAMWRLGRHLAGWSVVHQAGDADWDVTRRLYQRLGVPATVVRFVDDMPGLLGRTGLAVCRAGGTTLAELAAMGVPAVLLPYPHAADDHQRRNAEFYAEAGGCRVLDERAVAGRLDASLAEAMAPLLADAHLRDEMSRAMARLARPHAAAEVVAILQRLVAY